MQNSPSEFPLDDTYMKRAIELGNQARLLSPPNPWVGCVIAKEDNIIAEAHTQVNGFPHAETEALNIAGQAAKGSTLYVTLEPCFHFGKTPPCVQSIINAGISTVVIGVQDPDHRVNGQSIKILQEKGITTRVGICKDAVEASLRPYLWQRKHQQPYCIIKSAISADGRTATSNHTSQWITCLAARQDAHQLRAESQAILVGSGTVLADNPLLTVRYMEDKQIKQPLRVLLDSRGRVPAHFSIFDTTKSETLVITSKHCPKEVINQWLETGAEVEVLPQFQENGIDLHSVLRILAKRGIIQVLVEGGSLLIGSLLSENLANELVLYVGPCLLGDQGLPLAKGLNIHSIQEAPHLKLLSTKSIENSVRLHYASKP